MAYFGAPGAQDAILTDAQGARTTAITGNQTAPSDGSDVAISRSAPKIVRGEIAKRMLDAFNASTDRAKAMGTLGGYTDAWLSNNLGLQDTSRRIGTVNNFSQAESSLLGSEQDLAQQAATKTPSIWPGSAVPTFRSAECVSTKVGNGLVASVTPLMRTLIPALLFTAAM